MDWNTDRPALQFVHDLARFEPVARRPNAVMFPKFQDALVALPTVVVLDALLPGGVESIPEPIYEALRRDDVTGALAAGEEWYEGADVRDWEPRVAYPLLLESCDRLDDALEAVREERDRFEARPEFALAEAEIRLERRDDDRAREILSTFAGEAPEWDEVRPSVWGFAGDLLLDLGDEEGAVACYERAVEGGVEHFETTIRLAQLQQDREQWGRAAELFERAAALAGDAVGPWEEAAECWRRAGQLREALEARSRVLDHRTGDAETWAKQGIGYRHLGETRRAAEALEKATRFAPERPEYWIERAEVLVDLGRPERAIECYREVLDHDPDYLEARLGIASAALAQGDPSRAERLARRALEADETSPDAHRILARALRAQGDLEGAAASLRDAADCAEAPGPYHRERGEVLAEAGRLEAGLDELERAAELGAGSGTSPAVADALLAEGAYERLGDYLPDDEPEGPWPMLRPLYEAVLAGVDRDPGAIDRAVDALRAAALDAPDRLPVETDFGEIERFVAVLDAEFARPLEAMIAVLEGRKDAEDLEGLVE